MPHVHHCLESDKGTFWLYILDKRFLASKALTRCRLSPLQPHHLIDDAPYAEKRLGKERASNSSYLLRTLLEKGVPLTLGSDWTVAPLDALDGVHAATHRTPRGAKSDAPPWLPDQRISAEEALLGYTRAAAHASFWEDEIGSLEAGKLADFVVLDRNPLVVSNEVPRVLQTFVGGQNVYTAER
jgi:predicted amidohydrolase YtcJ